MFCHCVSPDNFPWLWFAWRKLCNTSRTDHLISVRPGCLGICRSALLHKFYISSKRLICPQSSWQLVSKKSAALLFRSKINNYVWRSERRWAGGGELKREKKLAYKGCKFTSLIHSIVCCAKWGRFFTITSKPYLNANCPSRRKPADLFSVCYRSASNYAADLQMIRRFSADHLQNICKLLKSAEHLLPWSPCSALETADVLQTWMGILQI